ncbi:permease IIC component [Clostridium polyendosporum]|uniref:Permease IIC component n=1 Tax=Clostridium polyendosporum TaxID=69208 RepID=A0A919S0X4_9CLOT|nr:PTS sugar transporter subunit IIC [Clostridium polyendosporum]GIM30215.1 permease IIC component [Clostridium polyendosporum]
MGGTQKISEKVIPAVMKFVNMKGLIALKDGLLFIMPLSIIGAAYLLLAQLPIPAFNNWMASVFGPGWTDPLFQVYGATFNIMAIVATMGIAYTYVKNEGHEPLGAAVMALVCFLTTTNAFVTDSKSGVTIANVIPKDWTGGKGLVTAILIGLFVGAVYSWFLNNNIKIKMPESVPQGVANAFTTLIPGAAVIFCAFLVYILFKVAANQTFIEWIYTVLQTPLQGATDSLAGALVIGALIPFFWWFGVHGSNLIGGVMQSLLLANLLSNQEMLSQTGSLSVANGAHIVTQQFQDQFLIFGGSGLTLGLVLAMLLVGRSAQSKSLGKMALIPGLFNINEPVIFGFPIVMNPIMFVPFIAAPTCSALLTYFSIKMGLVAPFAGVQVPWTTPAVISGFIVGGWRAALLQIIIIAMATAIYFPFFKKQDSINLQQEQEAEAA